MKAADYQSKYSRKPPSGERSKAPEGQGKPKGKRKADKPTATNPNALYKFGIDPGSIVTGMAITFNGPGQGWPVLIGFKSHCEAIIYAQTMAEHYGKENVHFVIEDARKATKNAYFANKNGHSKDKGAGYVSALSKDWECFCRDVLKVSYEMVAPNPKLTKWTSEQFEKLTGIRTLKTQHHLRDAFLLIYKPETK